jgi:hypothetical protein
MILFFWAANSALAQTDFFWSFDRYDAFNTDVSQDFEVGQQGSLFLFYSTIGPNETDISDAVYLDFATSNAGVIQFESAVIFDFGINVGGTPIGSRWTDFNGGGVFGETGVVSENFIDELHADNNGLGLGIDGMNNCVVFCDEGFNSRAEAFLVGEVEFSVVGSGTIDILSEIGEGGLINEGNSVSAEFGGATIIANNAIPEPAATSMACGLGLLLSLSRRRS